MKSQISKLFLREVEKEFNRIYPYLKIEFPKKGSELRDIAVESSDGEALQVKACNLLSADAGMADSMTVRQLEEVLLGLLDSPMQVFRKSGNIWLETKMTRDWTLKQQNDRGRELAT